MKKRTYKRMLWRGIAATRARFLSILAIVMLGSAILAGLLATTPDMQLTADKYYDDHQIYDIDIKGTYGLTETDIASLRTADGVEQVMGAYVTDIEMQMTGGESYVTRIYGMPFDKLNQFELIEGRLPENERECLIALPNGRIKGHELGETYSPYDSEKDLSDTYAVTQFTVVGIVRTPQYMSVENEPSTVGTGKLGLIMYVFPECYSMDVYTDAFLTVSGAAQMDAFSNAYETLIDGATDTLKEKGEERSQIRYAEVVNEAQDEIDQAKEEYNDAKNEANKSLKAAKQQIDDTEAQLDQADAEADAFEAALNAAVAAVDAAEQTLNESIAKQRADLAALAGTMTPEEYAAAEAAIDQAETAGRAEIALQRQEIAAQQEALSATREQIAAGRSALKNAKNKYDKAKQEADKELSEALTKIEDAQEDIDNLKQPKWYLFNRGDMVSFESYKSNSNKIGAIAKVFPIFFFFVAALVALTTMTRMVEEERTQTGTLKALGYSSASIMSYYLWYSAAASMLGGGLGLALGFKTLPLVISNAYGMMYTLPKVITVFRWNYAAVILAVCVVTTTAATYAACLSQLKEKPSALMLAKAPKAGKRVFLERITFLWKHMKFTQKVTARNIFRYKKRLVMTVTGIAGCCALLVTGFGLRDSIHDIIDKQFGEVYRFNTILQLSDADADQTDETVKRFLSGSKVSSYAVMMNETCSVEKEGNEADATFYVPKDLDMFQRQISIKERRSGAAIAFDDHSLILTEKMCETLHIKIGDTVTLKNSDGETAAAQVTGITENYVYSAVYISTAKYEDLFGQKPEYKTVYARIYDDSEAGRDAVSTEVLESDKVLMVQFVSTLKASFSNTVKSIDYIVFVLIFSAGALAIIVLYNLTNINICERKKELATIKVLGFHNKEVAGYIYRETTVLSVIGTLFGFAFGVWLHSFVIKTAEVDAVMFGRSIYFTSFLFAALVTLIFTALVDAIMLKKLKSIDMVESMKANE